jgi:hypothetical protein
LLNATRIESRWIHQRIAELNKKRFRLQDEIQKFDDLINKKILKIEKIVEQYQSLSIKTSVLGQDANLHEYWFFKDDPTKIFVKVEVAMSTENGQGELLDQMKGDQQAPTTSYEWYFIEEEEKFDQLFESLNLKGTREKKLQEGLKKIKGTIKLKKPKKLVRTDAEEAAGKEDDE